MYQIRNGVFETNSSSTHSLCICTEDEFTRFKNGEILYNSNSEKLEKAYPPSASYMKRAERYYNERKNQFMKDWEELEENDKLAFVYSDFDCSYAGDNLYESKNSYDEYFKHNSFETYIEKFTTPHGDKMVAFGHYGYDG